MNKIRILAALLAAMLLNGLTLATPAPGSAESGTVRDSSSDAPDQLDLVRLRGDNGARRVRIALHVDDLQDRGRFEIGVWWRDENIAYAYFARIRHTEDGRKVIFRRSKEGSDTDPAWTCAERRGELAFRPARDRIILSVPHGCLRAYDYYKVINDWTLFGRTHWLKDGRWRFDAVDLELDRG